MKVNQFELCRMAAKLARLTHRSSKSTLERTIKSSIEACEKVLRDHRE